MSEVSKTFPSQIKDRPFDLWRYRELLPIHNPNPSLRLGEGGTPLIQAVNLGKDLHPLSKIARQRSQLPRSRKAA
jgi:threonine synthase